MKKPAAKINEIKRQREYAINNAKQARDRGHDVAARQWESMVEAYSISLDILEEKGNFMPDEVVKQIVADHEASVEGATIEDLEAMVETVENERDAVPYYDFGTFHLLSLRRDAYKNVLYRLEEAAELAAYAKEGVVL